MHTYTLYIQIDTNIYIHIFNVKNNEIRHYTIHKDDICSKNIYFLIYWGFPGSSDGKEFACQ